MTADDHQEPGQDPDHTELEHALRAAADDERAVLREAESTSFDAGEARIARYLEEEIRRDGHPTRRWLLAVAAVALASTAAGIWMSRRASDGRRERTLLGGERIELLDPTLREDSEVRRWGTFRIRSLVPTDELSELRIVVYAGAEPSEPPLRKSPWSTELDWTPEPAECDDWPDTIYWEVLSGEPRSLLGSRVSRLQDL